jgi:hypothetical protein
MRQTLPWLLSRPSTILALVLALSKSEQYTFQYCADHDCLPPPPPFDCTARPHQLRHCHNAVFAWGGSGDGNISRANVGVGDKAHGHVHSKQEDYCQCNELKEQEDYCQRNMLKDGWYDVVIIVKEYFLSGVAYFLLRGLQEL